MPGCDERAKGIASVYKLSFENDVKNKQSTMNHRW